MQGLCELKSYTQTIASTDQTVVVTAVLRLLYAAQVSKRVG